MKFFLDTEFIERGPNYPVQLISIGIVDERGGEFYAVSSEFREEDCNDWVRANVLPHLGDTRRLSRSDIAILVREWVDVQCDGAKPEFWGYYADYDWVVTAQIFGTIMDLPKGWPMYCRDLKQLCDSKGNPKLPQQESTEHNALADARWNKQVYEFLTSRLESAPLREPPETDWPTHCAHGKPIDGPRCEQCEAADLALREPGRDEGKSCQQRFENWALGNHPLSVERAYVQGVTYRFDETEYAWLAWQAARAESQSLREQPKPKCPDCNSVGMSHCSDPEHCGGVYWPDHVYRDLQQKLATAGEVIGSAIEVLDELEDYFDARADADHNGERYVPNEAMKHLTAVRGLLTKAEEFREKEGRKGIGGEK